MTRRGFIGAAAAIGLSGCAPSGRSAEAAHPPIGAFMEVDGLRVHYLDRGAGPAVVLIHGASGNIRDFSFSLIDRLAAAGLRVIAFDRPGLGYSERLPAHGWEPAAQARHLRRATAALGVDRAIVVGHSWGAAAAVAWALDAPKGVAGVMSVAGALYPWGGDAGLLYALGASPIWSGAARRAAALLIDAEDPEPLIARIFRPDPPPPGYAGHIGVGLALRPETFRANAEDLDNLHSALERMAPRYSELSMPVEAIHGEADRTVWAQVHALPLSRAARSCRLTLLPGVGHMLHHREERVVVDGVLRLAAA